MLVCCIDGRLLVCLYAGISSHSEDRVPHFKWRGYLVAGIVVSSMLVCLNFVCLCVCLFVGIKPELPSGKSTFSATWNFFSATWNLHIPDMKYILSCSHFHVGILQFHVAKMQFHVECSVFSTSDMKSHVPTWNHMFRHEIIFPDMKQLFRSKSGH